MYASRTSALPRPAAWLATLGLVAACALAGAGTTLAGEGGSPGHHRSIPEILASERAEQSAEKTVVPAVAPSEHRWHDKSDEEWRAYHRQDRQWKARNVRR